MNCKTKSFVTKKKAFTLIELLIVIAIIGILFIVLISKVDFATDKSKATGVQTDFRSFQLAFEQVSRENAGFNTFGWDTGDLNANGKRDSYDEGDTNKDNIQDLGEVWTGHKVPGETFTKVFTLVKPGTTFETDGYDADPIAQLETAINANLDPKLHITIGTDGKITMANGAQDPWDKEYHGEYITNAEVDGKDRGAIIMYSDGANNEFGSEHKIANGIVSVSIPGNNKYGKDDYSIAVVYTFVNGYGEVKTQTSGFSNNQDNNSTSGNNSENDGSTGNNNGNNGGNVGDLNNVPVIGETRQFATNITTSTLKVIYDLSTSPDKEYGSASIAYNDNIYLWMEYFDDVYSIYYEYYNESEDYFYSYAYASEGIVELGYVPEAGWYTYDNNSGEQIKCNAPYITFVDDLTIDMPNGLSDITPLFVEHKHNFINCKCYCGGTIHNYINCECVCGDTIHNYINCKCVCGNTIHNYINCKCVVCGDINHMHDGLCPGLYSAGAIALAADGDVESAQYMFKTSWYELLDAGIVHVTNGVVYSNCGTWENASSDALDGDLILPNDGSITSIGDAIDYEDFYDSGNMAFKDCEKLTGISIPNSVTEITYAAFDCCTSLTSVTIPDGVISIGDAAFAGCSSLKTVIIGDDVKSIGNSAFSHCESLTSIDIPNSVTSIGYYVFTCCKSLTSVVIPDGVTEISAHMFDTCSNLTIVTIPDSVTYIDSGAFYNCSNLTIVTIPDSVTSIGYEAFENCTSLTSVTIPNSVTEICSEVFKDCSSLTSIKVDEGNTAYKDIDGNLYTKDGKTLIQYAIGKTDTSFTIPDGVTSIGDYAFNWCTNLTNVVIPDSVTTISHYAFDHCSSLANVVIGDSVSSIEREAFAYCSRLTSITFKGSVAQWYAITIRPHWILSTPITEIVCSDGRLTFK